MYVPPLWHSFARLGLAGQLISLDHGDLFKMIRKDTGGQQSSHTSADYDGMVPVGCALPRLFAIHDFPPSDTFLAPLGYDNDASIFGPFVLVIVLMHLKLFMRAYEYYRACHTMAYYERL
jgi:hypothetical protein